MIEGLYITRLEKLAHPAKLSMRKDALGTHYYLRYHNRAISFTIPIEEIHSVATHKQLVQVIENKISEARDCLIINIM